MRKPILSFVVFSLSLAVAVIFVTSFDLTTKSSAQNANSSTTTNKNQNDSRAITPGAQEDFSKNTWELPEDADKTKNPTAATPESIANGKALYMDKDKGNCIFCHGETGAGNEANKARQRRKPADLTNKEHMAEATDGELFWKISKGIRGIMPAGERKMSEAERWDVVNYVRTLGK
jgi:mono/diheme cytochrome c family protein